MSGASERANGQASGPVLLSVFLSVFDHSALHFILILFTTITFSHSSSLPHHPRYYPHFSTIFYFFCTLTSPYPHRYFLNLILTPHQHLFLIFLTIIQICVPFSPHILTLKPPQSSPPPLQAHPNIPLSTRPISSPPHPF